MDLFKFYVDDLKARFHEEKKIIKEIVKEKQLEVQVSTSYDDYLQLISADKRVASLDPNNIRLVFNGLYEKAELRERERLKEEHKKQKKLEQNFKSLLKKLEITEASMYDDIKEKISNEDAFLSIYSDKERERIFGDYINQMQETCLHHIKKKKEKRKKSKRSRSVSSPANDLSEEVSDEDDLRTSSKINKKDSSSHSNKHSSRSNGASARDESATEEKMDDEPSSNSELVHKSSKKHKKSKRKKKQKSVRPN